ncbi:MAG: hypothetical protein ACQEQS_09175 [Thermodesulfobacteriota bacterium]
MIVKTGIKFLLLFVLCFTACSLYAETPDDLEKWKSFVVHGEEKYYCPPLFNDDDKFYCSFPGILNIDIYKNRIDFKQNFTLFQKTGVKLPGSRKHFPDNVKIDNKPAPASFFEGSPAVFPEKKHFTVTGSINFEKIPDFIKIPDSAAGFNISLKTGLVKDPYTDHSGRLWLNKPFEKKEKSPENYTKVTVFRKIKDSIPSEIVSLYRINISGSKRQEKISAGKIPGKISYVKSPVPLRINNDNTFTIQAEPGTYEIILKNLIPRPLTQAGPFETGYKEEIIVHENSPGVRSTSWKGPVPVDPLTTSMPQSWKKYPAYILNPDEKIKIKETARGKDIKKPDLNLKREIWLDFKGSGATVKDNITGTLYTSFFAGIDKSKDLIPGKIDVNDQTMIITEKENLRGVFLKSGVTNIESVLRKNTNEKNFTKAWNIDFADISGSINIPRAWTPVYVSGADLSGRPTFISKWTLLDFFVLCILFLSAYKIWNLKWGIIFFICLGAIYHKFYIPPYLWIFLIISAGLLNNQNIREFLNTKKFIKFIFFSAYAAAMIIVLSAGITFTYKNLRNAVYPQLDQSQPTYYQPKKQTVYDSASPEILRNRLSESSGTKSSVLRKSYVEKEPVYKTPAKDYGYTQTGPGIPSWKNKKIYFTNGSENMKIHVLSPVFTRVFYVANVVFLLIIIFKFIPVKKIYKNKGSFSFNSLILLFIFSFFGLFSVFTPDLSAQSYPSENLLNTYKQRILEKKEFNHDLIFIKKCSINASASDSDKIKMELTLLINAVRDSVLPLPDTDGTFVLKNIELNGKNHDYILKDKNKILTFIPEGTHKIKLTGESVSESIDLKFSPLPSRLNLNTQGIETQGVNKDSFSDNIKLMIPKSATKEEFKSYTDTTPLPVITRELFLEKEWKIKTKVQRFYNENTDQRVDVSLNLLKNEKILKQTFNIKDNLYNFSLMPGQKSFVFESEIPVNSDIKTKFGKNSFLSVKWIIHADPVWEYEVSGIKPSGTDVAENIYILKPGESAEIKVSKLKPYQGRFLSIDSFNLVYDTTKTKNSLKIDSLIRSSKGRTHQIQYDNTLLTPEKIIVNSTNQPVSVKNNALQIPLSPGSNNVEIIFNEIDKKRSAFLPEIITFPFTDPGTEAVNINQKIKYPKKTWVLGAFGPLSGPAVLFWGYFITVVIAALILSKLPSSPLKMHQWFLLSAGLSLVSPLEIIIVFALFFIIEYRKKLTPDNSAYFNLIQTGIILMIIISAVIVYNAVSKGLLGIPDMQISGNGSWHTQLNWFTDRTDGKLPQPFIITAPLILWKIVIFVWSLWTASFLINKAPYFAEALKSGGFWKKQDIKKPKFNKKRKKNSAYKDPENGSFL